MNHLKDTADILKDGDAFSINFADRGSVVINVIVRVDRYQYAFVDLNNHNHWSNYDFLETELFDLEEIVEYLEYLVESREATVEYIGHISYKETLETIRFASSVETLSNAKKTTDSLFVVTFLNKVKESYTIKKEIDRISIENGDTIGIYSTEFLTIDIERIKKLGEEYLILPMARELQSSVKEELSTREEVNEYLFDLIVNESNVLKYIHTFDDNKQDSTLHHKSMQKIVKRPMLVQRGG